MPAQFEILFRLMVVLAIAIVLVPLIRNSDGARPWASGLFVVAVLAIGTQFGYSRLSTWDWEAAGRQAPSAPSASGNLSTAGELTALEKRVSTNPQDAEGWAILGVARVNAGDVDAGVRALEQANLLTGGRSPDVALALADALGAQRQDNRPRIGELVETLLGFVPDHPRALLYGAELAFTRGEYELAKARWGRLRDAALQDGSEQAQGVAEVLSRRIAAADQQASGSGASAAAPAQVPATATGQNDGDSAVTVSVTLDAALKDQVPSDATLFVLARPAQGGGPPLAVARRRAAELPLQVVLSDSDAMLPGRTISAFDKVEIVARIALSGTPVAQSGDLFGAATIETGSARQLALTISNVQP